MFIFALSVSIFAQQMQQQTEPFVELNLWGKNPPGMIDGACSGADDGTGRVRNVGIPGILVYLPEAASQADSRAISSSAPQQKIENKIALIVCPGGGFTHLTRLVGADGAVDSFLPGNVAVISLKYRTQPPSADIQAATLADGKRAVRLVRQNAEKWNIDPRKIGMLGWSAGANLALNVATHFDAGNPDASDPVEHESSRPDFVVLLSPWPAKRTIADFPVKPDAPPAFIGSAKDDKTAPVVFAEAIAQSYKQAGAKFSLLEVETGEHAAFTINAPGEGGKWIERFWPWLKEIGIRAE